MKIFGIAENHAYIIKHRKFILIILINIFSYLKLSLLSSFLLYVINMTL